MKHHYATINDISISYDEPRVVDGLEVIPFYCERPNDSGDFDFAEGAYPVLNFTRSCGFSEYELLKLRRILKDNERLIYDMALKRGAWDES